MTIPVPDPVVDPLMVLANGEVEVLGRLPWSSNATLLARVCHDGRELLAVYKPGRGERPLHDFPPGLYRREVAAYELTTHLGWGLVPETLERDGPLGAGSFQRFVTADHEKHYFDLLERPELHPALRRLAVFDLITNQTDRKGGHTLLGHDGQVWAVDNGLSFHVERKVRTVIWDFAGEPVPEALLADIERLVSGPLPARLAELLDRSELAALQERAEDLLADPVLPGPPWGRYSYPWPMV